MQRRKKLRALLYVFMSLWLCPGTSFAQLADTPPANPSTVRPLKQKRIFSGSGELDFVRNIPDFSVTTTADWELTGPKNAGGRIRAIAVDRDDSDVILAGGASGGIFRSTDAALTWAPVTSPEHIRLSSIAQDPREGHRDVWYATTGELSTYSFNYIIGHGVYKSIDNGVSWTRLASTLGNESFTLDNPFDIVNRVQVHPRTGHVYLAALYGIYRSADGGQTFELVLGDASAQDVFRQESPHHPIITGIMAIPTFISQLTGRCTPH